MSKDKKARFGLTMSPALLKSIDEKRGLIPRATYIEHCMKQYFELEELRATEIKFCREILEMLRKQMTIEKRSEMLKDLSLANARISERMESLEAMK